MEITNARVLSFYKENPAIDFNNANLLLVDLIEKLFVTEKNVNTTINTQLIKEYFQEPLSSLINCSEERIINSIKDTTRTKSIQNTAYHFKYVLNQIFCTGDVISISNTNNQCVFQLNRPNKPKILFETKDSNLNIDNNDTDNFIKLVEDNNCHGVFVSQQSGISSKPNYHIEYHHGNIVIYIHKADYSPDKLKIAIDIIDNLSCKIREINKSNDENSIPKGLLDDINKEYQLFISQKEALITVYKECQKKVLSQIDEIRFPCLEKYLSTKYTCPPQKQGFKCDLCKLFNANNLKALAAHKRGCVRKNSCNTN